MTKPNESQKTSAWMQCVKDLTSAKPYGQLQAKDKRGRPVVLDWKMLTVQSQDFSKIMKSICDIACAAYVPVEIGFLKQFSDTKIHEEYCKPFDAIFKNSAQKSEWDNFKSALKSNDWSTVEALMPLVIRQIYIMDYAAFGGSDLHFFVTAKDGETKSLLGFVEFFITPEYPSGDIKCPSFGIAPSEQNRGLGKLLMSSVFKILPNRCNRIFLSTRITNVTAQKAYSAWGFTPDSNPIQEPYFKQNSEHWIFMEYNTNRSSVLQKTANELVEK